MTRSIMIIFMNENPNVKIIHTLFDPEEYIYQKEDGKVYDENNYLFEDWYSDRNNGIRMRTGGIWDDGWYVKYDSDTCRLLSRTESGKRYLLDILCKSCQYSSGACFYLKEFY